jgi:2-isopropylmalate synthase
VKVKEMKQIRIFDTTLRDGEQSPGCSMNLAEKLEMAEALDKLGVDIIEAGFAISSPDDFKSVEAIAKVVKNATVASLARCTKEDIDRAWEAVQHAAHPRIHVFIATSDVHLKHKLQMSREQVIARIKEMVSYAKSKCNDIEFSAEDASRSDREFLVKSFETAIEAGATTLNVPDTVGYAMPQEMEDLIRYLKANVKGIDDVVISVHCHNDLGQAVACTLASIAGGATQVECTVNGIGERAGNASLEEIVMALRTRKDFFQAETNVNTKSIYRTSTLLSSITGVPVAPTKPIVGANAFAHEAGIHQHGVLQERTTYEIMRAEDVGIPKNTMVLGKHSGKHAFKDRLTSLGYDLSDEEIATAFADFKDLADKKKIITDKDIEALVNLDKRYTEDTYTLKKYSIVTTKENKPQATVTLENNKGKTKEVSAVGSGPVNAAFSAMNEITNNKYQLLNFTVQSVSEGDDALGEVFVKLGRDDGTITGRGLSTDIIEGSLIAYLNAINKSFISTGKE